MTTRLLRTLVAALAALAAGAAGLGTTDAAWARKLPTPVRGNEILAGDITPAGDVDEFDLYLSARDELRLDVREQGPIRGLAVNLSLTRPGGAPAAVTVVGAGTRRATVSYTAQERGVHRVKITGGPGQFAGATGNYAAAFAVRRLKPPLANLSDPAGGPISLEFGATADATLTLSAVTKKGALRLTELRRPDGSAEPGFAAALKAAKNQRSAKVSKFRLTGGDGTYTVVGSYDAGAAPKVKAVVKHAEPKRTRRLGPEPEFDAFFLPFPAEGIAGTTLNVVGVDFSYEPASKRKPEQFPTFVLGGIEIAQDDVDRPSGSLFRFPVPPGLAENASHDLVVVNFDGQSAVHDDAFFIVPPPVATGVTGTQGGPAGGRLVRITGTDFRSGALVLFGTTVVQPTVALPTRIDVVSPPHAPGAVTLKVRDEFGRTANVPQGFTYLDVPSNVLTALSFTPLQSLGGQTVDVTGSGFVASSVLTLDGDDTGATRVSSSILRFTTPPHPDGTGRLRVTDEYGQTSVLDVPFAGFDDATDTRIPAPVTTANRADGWRATRVLAGDVTGDGLPDLVLLRPASAGGASSLRSRVRVLRGSATGTFSDVTSTSVPAVSGDEDHRARDGVLADLDGDDHLDLAIVTDEAVGTGSSLRILWNNGSGVFAADASRSLPATSGWGDRNQGVALVAADIDGVNGADLVLLHASAFFEDVVTVVTPGDPGDPGDPTDDIPEVTRTDRYHYPALRVLLNDGGGSFTRSLGSVPSVDGTEAHQFQGDAIAAGNLAGSSAVDIVLTRDAPTEFPAGTFLRTAVLLVNDGGVLEDASSSLPAASGAEFLQGDRLLVADADGDTDLDILVGSSTPLSTPGSGTLSSASALRLLLNSSGTFSAAGGGTFPAADRQDRSQCEAFALGDLSGDGNPELVLVSSLAPNAGERAGRVLRGGATDTWVRASEAFPDPGTSDDLRGADVVLVDVDDDGDLDVVIVRDGTDETVRNTRVLVNPRL